MSKRGGKTNNPAGKALHISTTGLRPNTSAISINTNTNSGSSSANNSPHSLVSPPAKRQRVNLNTSLPKLKIGKLSFSDFTGSGFEFNIPKEVSINNNEKILIDNLWSAFNRQDRPYMISCLNGLAYYFSHKNNESQAFIYAVMKDNKPGFYDNWPEASAQVNQYPGAKHKKYTPLFQAFKECRQHMPPTVAVSPSLLEQFKQITSIEGQIKDTTLVESAEIIKIKQILLSREEEILHLKQINAEYQQKLNNSASASYASAVAEEPVTTEDKIFAALKQIQERQDNQHDMIGVTYEDADVLKQMCSKILDQFNESFPMSWIPRLDALLSAYTHTPRATTELLKEEYNALQNTPMQTESVDCDVERLNIG